MKYLIKGIGLGISLIFANRLCCNLFDEAELLLQLFSTIIFFIVVTFFLVSEKIPHLLICGFTGLFIMFFGEILMLSYTLDAFFIGKWFVSYIGGFYGSLAALLVSVIITAGEIKLFKGEDIMSEKLSKCLKIKLLIYLVISAIGFSYLIMPENAGISVPIFVIIQIIYLLYTVPDKKRLFLFIPIFIMSLNCFLSANNIWRLANIIVSIVLYSCMFLNFDFKKDDPVYIIDVLKNIIKPIFHFKLPFKWVLELNSEKAPLIKRIVLALIITIPCATILIIMLCSADMVFSLKTQNLMNSIYNHINFHTVFIAMIGIIAGLYLFGTICCSLNHNPIKTHKEHVLKGDLIIINILLSVILFVYTFFVIIQFKYLFAGSNLPAGLSYTQYARKGFFELLILSGINIAIILTVTAFAKPHQGKWSTLTKVLCHYLCAVTIVILTSSFYRMFLYANDDGLTRLRFFVMGFLIFEAVGLLITFFYIAKPNFNITLIYICLALIYYTVLNIVPTDNIIAKNQIDKYLNNERSGLEYIFTLSADAAPAMKYLHDNTNDESIKANVESFLQDRTNSDIPQRWQRYNISTENAKDIIVQLQK